MAALVAVIVTAGPASAQSASPSPASGPSVDGQVTGALAVGSTLTIRIDGTMPGGWEALHLLEASITSGNQELDRLRFDIEDNKLTVGDQDLIVGTGATATSEYLRVSGADVIVTTGGANLSFEVDAHVVKTIPEDARFVLGVVDDFGVSAEVTQVAGGARERRDHLGDRARAHRGRAVRRWVRREPSSRPSGAHRRAPRSTTPSSAGSTRIAPSRAARREPGRDVYRLVAEDIASNGAGGAR